MGSDYDKIIKENLRDIIGTLIKKVIAINPKKITQLNPILQKTDERKADFVYKVYPYNQQPIILHIEFQSTNDKSMILRMLRYFNHLYDIFRLEIKQYVFYIGKDKLRMQNRLELPNISYAYELIDFRSLNFKDFLYSDEVGEIIFAILCNFSDNEAREVVKKILKRLRKFVNEETILLKYIKQLEIISLLRDLQPLVLEEEKEMSIMIDITKDLRYQQGVSEGFMLGENKWKMEGKMEDARNMLHMGINVDTISKATGLSREEIERLK